MRFIRPLPGFWTGGNGHSKRERCRPQQFSRQTATEWLTGLDQQTIFDPADEAKPH